MSGVAKNVCATQLFEPLPAPVVTRGSIRDGASLEGSHRAALLARGGYWLEEYGHALILSGDLLKAGSVAAVVGDPTIDVELTAAQGCGCVRRG